MQSQKTRIPLDQAELDVLDLRIRDLLTSGMLTEAEAGRLMKEQRRLRGIDPTVMRLTSGVPLPEPDLEHYQPFYCFAGMGGTLGEMVQDYSNYIARVRTYIARVEARLFGPGDDI